MFNIFAFGMGGIGSMWPSIIGQISIMLAGIFLAVLFGNYLKAIAPPNSWLSGRSPYPVSTRKQQFKRDLKKYYIAALMLAGAMLLFLAATQTIEYFS